MKRMMRLFAGALALTMLFTACSSNEQPAQDEQKDNAEANVVAEGEYKVGIAQFAEHGSLDNCREGFLQGLADEGIVEGENLTVDFQNAQADMAITNQIATSMVSNDLVCAIATPMAQAAYNQCEQAGVPTIFTAVTDPIAASLANEDGTPVGEVTGTSDKLPVSLQLEMIRKFMPEAKKIGILYTTSEVNSVSAIEEYKALAPDFGFEIVESGVSTSADIPLALDSLLTQVDCLSNLTDNTVVSALATVLDKANSQGIPVFGSEVEQVKNGCAAAAGLDYVALGVQTGKMAAKVLKGEAKASEINFEVIDKAEIYVNNSVLDKLSLTLPEEYVDTAIDATIQ